VNHLIERENLCEIKDSNSLVIMIKTTILTSGSIVLYEVILDEHDIFVNIPLKDFNLSGISISKFISCL
jgi:hypothetical protein